MPLKVSRFGDQSAESEELLQISPHCTWCTLYAVRLQERCNRGQHEPSVQGDSCSSMGGKRKLMYSRRKGLKSAVCDSGRDTSADESLSQKGSIGQCGRHGPDVREKCSNVRNTCQCNTEGEAKATGTDAKCVSGPSPGAELLKTCEGKTKCDHEPETTASGHNNFRQIVMESRCPCLCAYLLFADTVEACTCLKRSPSFPTPDRDSKTPENVHDDRTMSPPASNKKTGFGCCVARYFSAFRTHSKGSTRDVNTHQPLPLPLEQKNSVAIGDSVTAKDSSCDKHLIQCARCQTSCQNCEMLKSNFLRKPSQRESILSPGVQRDTDVDTAPRASTEIMGRESCSKCRQDPEKEKEPHCVRCTCDCESRNKDLKNFRSSLQRICRVLSSCKRSNCTCDCHGKQGERRDNRRNMKVLGEEENKRSRTVNGGAAEKTSLPKRGLLALKYEILRCKEVGSNSNEIESGSSVCGFNQRGSYCLKCPPKTEHGCSCKNIRGPVRKTDKCCVDEKKKCSNKACINEQKQPRRLKTYKAKNDSREKRDETLLRADISSDDEMIAVNMHPKEVAKQKKGSKKKSKLAKRQTGRSSPDDSSGESDLEFKKSGARKAHKMKTDEKASWAERYDDSTNFIAEPIPNPINAEFIKIGNRYYQAIRHRTAHVNIMSFKKLKDHGEKHHRWKGKKSPRIEVRLKYDTTSSDELSSEGSVVNVGPVGDAPHHRSKLEKRKDRKRRIARDETSNNVVRADINEVKQVSKKRHRVLASTAATDGQIGNAPTPLTSRKYTDGKGADRKDSSEESMPCNDAEQMPKALTAPPSDKGDSPRGWKSNGTHLKRKGVSPRALELKEMSQRWLTIDEKQCCSDQVDVPRAQLKRKGVSPRTLELKQMSDRWCASDTRHWRSDNEEVAGDAINSGCCDVRPFTASSSAS